MVIVLWSRGIADVHGVQYLVLTTSLLKVVYDQAAEKAKAKAKARVRKEQEESSEESPEDGMTRTTTSTQDGYLFAILVMICFISTARSVEADL